MTSTQKSILIALTVIFSAGVTPIAIRINQAQGMPSLVILFIRLWLITIGLFPIVWIRHRDNLLSLTRAQIAMGAIAGFWLAINLLMLFFALEYTSVMITSVLRRTTPLWIIAPEIFLLGATFSKRIWWSVGVTFAGVILIAIGGSAGVDAGSHPIIGASMASFGAICFGIYLLIGRKLSDTMPTFLYSWLVFLSAAITLNIIILFTRTPIIGYSASAYMWALIVTFSAQILGQMVINIGLKSFSATAMAIILQVGVVLSVVIAVILFAEIPTIPQGIGSVLVVIGVLLATIEQNQRKTKSISDMQVEK